MRSLHGGREVRHLFSTAKVSVSQCVSTSDPQPAFRTLLLIGRKMTSGERGRVLRKGSPMPVDMRTTGRIGLVFMFALYWGGLTFYTGIVVRIIHLVLNDPMDGGLITQKVTLVLQVLGACTLQLMLVNDFSVARNSKRLGITLLGLTLILSFALVYLFTVHSQLDQLIDTKEMLITDRVEFDAAHRRYNQTTTVQWLAAVAYLPLSVHAWRVTDSAK